VLAPGTVQPPNRGPYAGVVLATPNAVDVSQRWMVTGTVPVSGDANIQIVNAATKLPVQAALQNMFPIWPISSIVCSQGNFAPGWNAKGDPVNGYAIRPQSNEHVNVNALVGPSHQAHAGTYVGLWQWGGGQDNEVWFFDVVSAAALAEGEDETREGEAHEARAISS
jgi:hypothetical protein